MGVAIAAIGGNPIAIAVAALTVGALVVRKYWQPIAAWITGVFDGIRTAVGPAFAELGAALAPLKPVWDGITGAVSAALNWFMKLLQPVNMTQEQLKKAGDAGRSFGSVIGGVMAFVVRSIRGVINAIKRVIDNMGKVAGFASMLPGVGPIGSLLRAGASLLGRKPAAAAPGLPAPTRGRVAPPAPPIASRGGGNVTVHQIGNV